MDNVKHWAVGMDIGGTNSQAAVIHREDGRIVARTSRPTLAHEGPQAGLVRFGQMVREVLEQANLQPSDLAGIGIGCTGPLDRERGLIMEPWTMPGWIEVPIVDTLANQFGVPVSLDNDANAAALGEHWIGAGRGKANMLYVTVSTGIGSGIIIDNQLRRGFGDNMGEVGLMSIDFDGIACADGSSGCWEFLASGPALAEAARAQADETMLAAAGGDPAKITAKLVAELAASGHPLAQSLIEREAFYLGVGIANLIVILAPEIVVLGGGVMNSWSLLEPTLVRTVRQRTRLLPSAQQTPIVRAALGLSAGFIGAARLAFTAPS